MLNVHTKTRIHSFRAFRGNHGNRGNRGNRGKDGTDGKHTREAQSGLETDLERIEAHRLAEQEPPGRTEPATWPVGGEKV